MLSPPLNGNTPFTGVGNLCESTNRGDPILQYDKRADRWVLNQFAFNVSGGNPVGPYLQCIAVSTTNNPLGSYNRYTITFSSTSPNGFNDYGKLGIFDDGYYTSYNIFGGSPAGSNTGVALCASDRVKMLAGLPATTLCAPVALYGGGASYLPADVDGATAPTTVAQGNIFARYSFGGVSLRLLKLKPNFAAGTATLNNGMGGAAGTFINLPVGPTTVACNGTGRTCVAQPTTANRLDTLGDRWMGSVAMDKNGNMLMGFSYANASANVFPSIAIAGRLRSDVRNTMRAQQIAWNGSGAQTGTLTRWCDYTSMQIDPADDCTFWYIGQYLPANGTFNWQTCVVSHKFPGCN